MNTQPKSNYDAKRARLIKLVHIAANSLGLIDPKRHETDPEDDYHLLLRQWNRPGTRQPVASSVQMSTAQLEELYRHLKRLGFKVRRQRTDERGQTKDAPSPYLSPEGRGNNEVVSPPRGEATAKRYASSLAGLREEIVDLAKSRWGDTEAAGRGAWEIPLNNFCRRFGVERWQWLDVTHGRAVKAAILRLQKTDAEMRGQGDAETTEVPF